MYTTKGTLLQPPPQKKTPVLGMCWGYVWEDAEGFGGGCWGGFGAIWGVVSGIYGEVVGKFLEAINLEETYISLYKLPINTYYNQ